MVVKVYIWNFKSLDTNVGHASLSLESGTYFSWWPEDHKRGKTLFTKVPAKIMTYEEDCDEEGGLEDMCINIIDVNEAAIEAYLKKLRRSGKKYDLANLNCCTVVYEALKAGGALHRLTRQRIQFWETIGTWSPNRVHDFVMELKDLNPRKGAKKV